MRRLTHLMIDRLSRRLRPIPEPPGSAYLACVERLQALYTTDSRLWRYAGRGELDCLRRLIEANGDGTALLLSAWTLHRCWLWREQVGATCDGGGEPLPWLDLADADADDVIGNVRERALPELEAA